MAKESKAKDGCIGCLILICGSIAMVYFFSGHIDSFFTADGKRAVVRDGPTKPPETKQEAPATQTIDKSPAMQKKRGELIAELIQKGIFLKLDQPATLPHLYITPSFRALDVDTKKEFLSVVYAFCYDTIEIGQLIVLRDSLNGKRIGSYNPQTGLSLD